MTFPETVEYSTFYWAAKKKGVKVQSKLAGVYINLSPANQLYFKTCCKVNGKVIRGSKYYPFNSVGEKQAHQEYLRMCETHKGNMRGRTSPKEFLK